MTLTTPLFQGRFVIKKLGFAMINLLLYVPNLKCLTTLVTKVYKATQKVYKGWFEVFPDTFRNWPECRFITCK